MEDGLRKIVYSQGGVIKNKDRYVCHCIIIKINLFLNCGFYDWIQCHLFGKRLTLCFVGFVEIIIFIGK